MAQEEEKGKNLTQRMYELMRIKNKTAYAEWKKFFENEFTEEADISLMQTLLEIVRAYPLQSDVVRLIIDVMSVRAHQYQTKQESDKALMATEIVKYAQAQIPRQAAAAGANTGASSSYGNYKKKKGGLRVVVMISSIIVVISIVIVIIMSLMAGSKEREVCEQAAEYLNEKYEGAGYTAEDLDADEAYLFGGSENDVDAYWIDDRETYARIVYAVSEKGKSEFICFDNLQEREIKTAFEEKMNSITGQTEGRLFWNSSSGSAGVIEDGVFQTTFEGDFDEFIEKESAVREACPGEMKKKKYVSSSAKNGNCDYYMPDPLILNMKQRLTTAELPTDEALKETLDQYADEYNVQFRGIMLPQEYFNARMNAVGQSKWDSSAFDPEEDIVGGSWISPKLPFIFMTNWYVNVPSEDEKMIGIKNNIYTMQAFSAGEGIYAVQSRITDNMKIFTESEMTDSFGKTDIPESVELSDSEKVNAFSICYIGGNELTSDFTLALDKEVCKIADRGYKVFITEIDNIDEEEEETEEYDVHSYNEEGVSLRYDQVMEGEGYLFIEYPSFYDWEKPHVITIVNP